MNIRQNIAKKILGSIFATVNHTNQQQSYDENEGYHFTEFRGEDGCLLKGYTYCPPTGGDRGTLILLHGFTCNAWAESNAAKIIADKYNLTSLAYDQRGHGSFDQNFVSTFGYKEGKDISSAITHAQSIGLKPPFILRGVSLGAMGIQCALCWDERIDGAITIHPPQSASHAIDAVFLSWKAKFPFLGEMTANTVKALIDWFYSDEIMRKSDIFQYSPMKDSKAKICYIMGKRDHFGRDETLAAFNHWEGKKAYNQFPSEADSDVQHWWFEFDTQHPNDPPNVVQSWDLPEFYRLEDEFIQKVIS